MNELADKNQEVFNDFEVPDPVRIRKAIKFIKKQLPDFKNARILECGAAKGGVADLLSREGVECVAVDINPRKFPGVRFIQRDLNSGFPDDIGSFDVVFAGEVMEHIFNDSDFLQSARRVLKPSGFLILTVPNLLFGVNRLLMLFGQMPKFAYAPYHYHFYNKRELAGLIEEAGFEIEKITSSHVLFSTRRNKLGAIFEWLGDVFPAFGAHLIVFAKKK